MILQNAFFKSKIKSNWNKQSEEISTESYEKRKFFCLLNRELSGNFKLFYRFNFMFDKSIDLNKYTIFKEHSIRKSKEN
jgi:hypothetical protein